MIPNAPPAAMRGGLAPDALASLFQPINGLRNHRALIAMLGCMIVGVLIAGLFSLIAASTGVVIAFLGGVMFFIAGATGINAAGVLLMDQARGLPPRRLTDALVDGVLCIPKFILLGLSLLAVALLVFIVLAIVFVVCTIPLLGPVLFVAVFPLSVVIAGLTLCGLSLCLFLALPAIWEGASVAHALAQALTIARGRLIESMLRLTVVGLLAMTVGMIVFGVLFIGLMPTIGMSAAVLGSDGMGGVLGMLRGHGGVGDDGSVRIGGAAYAIAAGLGAGMLWALAGSLLSLVYLYGLNLVYLRVIDGLDVGATEAALKAQLDDAKREAAELGRKAKAAAGLGGEPAPQAAAPARPGATPSPPTTPAVPEATAPYPPPHAASETPPVHAADIAPREPPPGSTTPAVAKARICPQCLSAVASTDLYCGVCGVRLP